MWPFTGTLLRQTNIQLLAPRGRNQDYREFRMAQSPRAWFQWLGHQPSVLAWIQVICAAISRAEHTVLDIWVISCLGQCGCKGLAIGLQLSLLQPVLFFNLSFLLRRCLCPPCPLHSSIHTSAYQLYWFCLLNPSIVFPSLLLPPCHLVSQPHVPLGAPSPPCPRHSRGFLNHGFDLPTLLSLYCS